MISARISEAQRAMIAMETRGNVVEDRTTYVPEEKYYSLEMRRITRVFLLSVLLGLVGMAASSTREPWGVYQGFPLAYSYPNPITCQPNPFNGCGFYYDPVMIVLDYLFWLGIAVAGLSVISVFWNRLAREKAQDGIRLTKL